LWNIISYSANVIVLLEIDLFEIDLFEIDLFEMVLFHSAIERVFNYRESVILEFIAKEFDLINSWLQKQKDGQLTKNRKTKLKNL
jgi:hypothetical protein